MARTKEKLGNLLEYFGIRSRSYYHSETEVTYDSEKPLVYYLDQTRRAAYPGPYDPDGLPLYVNKGVTYYLPVLICSYALGHLEICGQKASAESLSRFLTAVDWLVSQQDSQGVWLTNFPMEKFGLLKPYPCAMVQGLGISCLTRAFLTTNDETFLESAVRAMAPYRKDVRQGGVASCDKDRVFYEEFPAVPYRHVLNGFIFAMWGLHDLVRVIDSRDAKELYNEGLKTLVEWLPRYDIGYWSLYHIGEGPQNPATVPYHRLHVAQLAVMYALTGHRVFKQYQKRWSEYLSKPFSALRTLPAKVLWQLAKPPVSR